MVTTRSALFSILIICVVCFAGYSDDTPRLAAEMMQKDGAAKMPAETMAAYGASKEDMVANKNAISDAVENIATAYSSETLFASDSLVYVVDGSGKVPDGAIPGVTGEVTFAPSTVITYSEGTITIGDPLVSHWETSWSGGSMSGSISASVSGISGDVVFAPGTIVVDSGGTITIGDVSALLAMPPDGLGAGMTSMGNAVSAESAISGGGTFLVSSEGQIPSELTGYVSGTITGGVGTTTTNTSTVVKAAEHSQGQSNAKFVMDRVQKQRQAVREAIEGKKEIEE